MRFFRWFSSGMLGVGLLCFPLAADAQAPSAEWQSALQSLDRATVNQMIDAGIFAVNDRGYTTIRSGVSRVEFVAVVMRHLYPQAAQDPSCFEALDPDMSPGYDYSLLFADVSVHHPHANALCAAMLTGVVKGYADGTFRPNRTINFAEAAKVLNVAFRLDYVMADYDHEIWYASYVQNLRKHDAIPETIHSYGQSISQEEAEQMVRTVSENTKIRRGSSP